VTTQRQTRPAANEAFPPGNLRRHNWPRFLQGPDPELLGNLYVPALSEAVRYDRSCSYFSSYALARAARGFGKLIERLLALGDQAPRPAVRLLVNEQLDREDVQALLETGDPSRLESQLKKRLKSPQDLLARQRLAMLAWLAQAGWLEIRVGVMRSGVGIHHGKFGIARDETGDAVIFMGTSNETADGLMANYENVEISTSWQDPERYQHYVREFEDLWGDNHAYVHTVSLPEAVRLQLIKFAPAAPPVVEPQEDLERKKAAMFWQFIVEAPYLANGGPACDATALVELWPHQRRVVEEAAGAWPEGRLLCDEVGLGKTIEAILILRRLLAGRGVRRALLLVPAGLLGQWQGELREKGGLLVPRLMGPTTLAWPDGGTEKVGGLGEALTQDILIMSRELARLDDNRAILLTAEPWDLVLLDEAHAARRGKQEEGEFNSATLLLQLLRDLQLKGKARGFLLLSATPMQTQPWEPWDLLSILGEGGVWLAEFKAVRDYYQAVAAVRQGACGKELSRQAAVLIAADPDFPQPPGNPINLTDTTQVAQKLAFVPPTQRDDMAAWLRRGSPLGRRMHRNTRGTLKQYHSLGLLQEAPPTRKVEDIVFEYQDVHERQVYDAITRYIDKRFEQIEKEKTGKGFVMTVYRRRAASSPLALERSLERRREGLKRVAAHLAYDWYLQAEDVPEALEIDDLPEGEGVGKVSSALPTDPRAAKAELAEVEGLLDSLRGLPGDSKRDKFLEVLRGITDEGRAVLVFTEYGDTLDYLRTCLKDIYPRGLACYSGAGGERWDGEEWQRCSKGAITQALQKRKIQVLLCTDAASEGLNLQAAGAVINYDLPWNPARVEQRIGRIDRIGQQHPQVWVVNLFIRDSVDDKVYRALQKRCGLFKHFVGAMQPVLARARRMLLYQEPFDMADLEATASLVQTDALAAETYFESQPESPDGKPAAITLADMEEALKLCQEGFGVKVKALKEAHTYEISGPGFKKTPISAGLEALEKETKIRPLSPFDPFTKKIAGKLLRPGERLPLVVASAQEGPFRSTVAMWVRGQKPLPITALVELKASMSVWNGQPPEPEAWHRARQKARQAAERQVKKMNHQAQKRVQMLMARQIMAAKIRLTKELGRFLMCLGGTGELNAIFNQQMSQNTPTAIRLKQCFEMLGNRYPDWSMELRQELEDFYENLPTNKRQARILGKEVDAALRDPRWQVKKS